MTFILFLLFIFIVIPLLRAAWRIYRVQSYLRSQAEAARQAFNQAQRNNRPAGWSDTPRRKKIFDKSDGEYIEWEEIETTHTDTTVDADGNVYTDTRTSHSLDITDVEWEDIK